MNTASYIHEIPIQQIITSNKDSNDFNWKNAIIYAIMVDRFLDGDKSNTKPVQQEELHPKANFYGGDLQGILEKLEEGYFEDLGINVLWLSPIIQNTFGAFREYPEPHRYFTGYHGYWPIDHEKVDVRFGDLDLFKKLVSEAHQRGIKVILDFVANHVHQEHVYFQKHPEWFGTLDLPDDRKNIRLWDEQRLTTWFDTFLPSFDFLGSEEALQVMTDNAVWWVKETGIDGFRQDAVKHIPNDFWRILTLKLKKEIELKENRSIYQIGETFGGYDLISSYVNNGQLNAQFNFNLYDVALSTYLDPDGSFTVLNDEMHRTFEVYGVNHLMGNIMDSHDKVRFLAYADGDISFSNQGNATEIGWIDPPRVDDPASYRKAQLYQAFLMTIPGVPVIYYGDEIGMTGAADPDNRRPMRFDDQLSRDEKEMNRVVKKLVQIRRDHPALRYGDFLPLYVNKDSYIFMRSTIRERILVILNKTDNAQKLLFNVPKIYKITHGINLDTLDEMEINNSQISVTVDGMGWQIYQLTSRKTD
jgi:glycosidase